MIRYAHLSGFHMLLQLQGSVYLDTLKHAIPGSLIGMGFSIWRYYEDKKTGVFESLTESYAYAVFTFVLGFVVVFRCQLAYGRFWEGRQSLEMMTNNWLDACIKCVTFDQAASVKLPPENIYLWRTKITSLFSLLHGTALGGLGDQCAEMPILKGLDPVVIEQLNAKEVKNDVYVVYTWIQDELIFRMKETGLDMPPPITTRLWQDLTQGMQGYNNAAMIRDTPFPFPFAQIVALLLGTLTLTCGYMLSIFIPLVPLCVFFTFLAVSGYHSLNYVARQLEDPFGDDDNDLPLTEYQDALNGVLQQLRELDTGAFTSAQTSEQAYRMAMAQAYNEADVKNRKYTPAQTVRKIDRKSSRKKLKEEHGRAKVQWV